MLAPGAKTLKNHWFYCYFGIFWTIGVPPEDPQKGECPPKLRKCKCLKANLKQNHKNKNRSDFLNFWWGSQMGSQRFRFLLILIEKPYVLLIFWYSWEQNTMKNQWFYCFCLYHGCTFCFKIAAKVPFVYITDATCLYHGCNFCFKITAKVQTLTPEKTGKTSFVVK